VDGAEGRNGISLVAGTVEARDMEHLLSLVDRVRDRIRPGVVALGADLQGKAALVVSVSPEVDSVDAGRIVQSSAREFKGGGGGTRLLGRGGGGDPTKLPEAVEAARLAALNALGG
jgi:alanyl-tRNA synthetase